MRLSVPIALSIALWLMIFAAGAAGYAIGRLT